MITAMTIHVDRGSQMMRRAGRSHGPSASSNRGVAMLLVVISMLMATVLTTAYLASRDNSAAIGQNVSNASAARWAADTGIELAVAALQTEKNWRQLAITQNRRIITNFSVSGGVTNVEVMDLASDAPPSTTAEYVRLVSRGTVGGIDQISTATAYVPLEPGRVIDVDLSEFAAFVSQTLTLRNQAVIARWPVAPLSVLGRRVAVGTQSSSASSIVLENSSAALDVTVVHASGASSSLIANSTSPDPRRVALLDVIPFPLPPPSNESPSLLTLLGLTMSGGSATANASTRHLYAELKNNAVRTLRGDITVCVEQDLRINSGAKLIIDGNVKVVVFGDVDIDGGSIELKPGARLRLYVRGDGGGTSLRIRDGFIGELRAHNLRDNTGRAAYIDPQRITIMSMSNSDLPEWLVEQNSVIKGSMYAPHLSRITVANTSAVYGRIASRNIELKDDAALYFDPALDSRCGYSNTKSAVFDADGHIRSPILSLSRVDSSDLQQLADATDLKVKSDLGSKIVSQPADAATTTDNTPAGEATPRPVQVQYDMVSFGTNIGQWE